MHTIGGIKKSASGKATRAIATRRWNEGLQRWSITRVWTILVLLCLCTGLAAAQGTSRIDRWVIDGGGGRATGGATVALASTLGQAAAGSSNGGNVRLQSGFWGRSGGVPSDPRVTWYIPAVFVGGFFGETIDCGTTLRDFPEDQDDWYTFELQATQTVTIRVQNFQAVGDLLLYRDSPNGDLVAQWGKGGAEMTIGPLPLGAGSYYVRVYVASGHNTTASYSLTLSCQ